MNVPYQNVPREEGHHVADLEPAQQEKREAGEQAAEGPCNQDGRDRLTRIPYRKK